jgi:glycerophosphoryl diester phosphodiesterase
VEASAQRPLVLAHRGALQEAPENTLPAFRLALEQGADGVELDVRLTRDGQPIVFHDATLNRTTDGRGLVARATLSELRRLDAGAMFGPAFAGTRLCTLGEALETLSSAKLVNIELKGPSGPGGQLERQVLEAVEEAGARDRVVLSSFGPTKLKRLRRIDRQVAAAWLHGSGPFLRLGLF